ncbi:hypothetical protein [Corynebacterium resistens]|uniref:hypothetical protein n=1 Tax=Corynebacterium resistens TaxID=258224 RepID=UPI002356F9A2|nr:hypothetical protein [Corynebacterium resistens]
MVNKNPNNQWGENNEPNDQWGSGNARGNAHNDQWGSPAPASGNSPSTSAAPATPATPAAPAAPAAPATPAAGKSSKSRIVLAALAVLALVGIAAGGWHFAQRDDSNEKSVTADEAADKKDAKDSKDSKAGAPTTKSAEENSAAPTSTEEAAAQDKGPCDPTLVAPNVARTSTLFCDGQWMLAGAHGTDAVGLYYWTGDEWGSYETDGNHRTGSQGRCYSYGKLKDANAPSHLLDLLDNKTMLCEEAARMDSDADSTPRLSQPRKPPANENRGSGKFSSAQCDGRYVVIVDSVLVYPGQDPGPFVNASLAANPGAKATSPGACGSLRASVDGADVYPVYRDYGSDRAGACAAEARGEGNARKLQSAADYSSPC